MKPLGLSACALAGLFAALPTPSSASTAKALRSCSVAGARVVHHADGVTSSVRVTKLRQRGTSCATARSVAMRTARALLNDTAVPTTIKGMRVTVTRPCAGCTPIYTGVARSSGRRVTFTMKGGA